MIHLLAASSAENLVNWALDSVKAWAGTVLVIAIILSLIGAFLFSRHIKTFILIFVMAVIAAFTIAAFQKVGNAVSNDVDAHSGSLPAAEYVMPDRATWALAA